MAQRDIYSSMKPNDKPIPMPRRLDHQTPWVCVYPQAMECLIWYIDVEDDLVDGRHW